MEQDATDRQHMERALRLAANGEGFVEPNPMVGAVVVKDGRVVAEGHHAAFGGPHAEVAALNAARSGGHDPAGATLYVTLEPCAHHGKTLPCAPAVVEAGVRRVVAATLDPMWPQHAARTGAGARGLDVLTRAGIETQVGVCRDEAVMLNAPFFKRAATGLPLVIAKWAMSADGKIAARTGSSRWISSAQSRRMVHELRGRVDAIVVGCGTVERDDPLLTCRDAQRRRTAARVVLCGRRAPCVTCALVRTAREAPVLIAYCAASPPEGLDALGEAGCTLLALPGGRQSPDRPDPGSLLKALADRDAMNVLVEGGRDVLGSFFDEHLVDKAVVFVAPTIIGGAQAVTPVGGSGVQTIKAAIPLIGHVVFGDASGLASRAQTAVRLVGRDVVLEGWVSDPQQWAPAGQETKENGHSEGPRP